MGLAEGSLVISPMVSHKGNLLSLECSQWSHSHVWWLSRALVLGTSVHHITPSACSKRTNHKCANIYQVPACSTFTNTHLSKGSHMAKRSHCGRGLYRDVITGVWVIRNHYYHSLPKMYYNYLINYKKSYKCKNCNIKSNKIVKVKTKIVKSYKSKFELCQCLPRLDHRPFWLPCSNFDWFKFHHFFKMSFEICVNGDTFEIHVCSRINGNTKRQTEKVTWYLVGQKVNNHTQ